MIETFLLVGLPYLAIVACIAGTIHRFRKTPYNVSALSSQFLEHRTLKWGSVPWHAGIVTILLAHLFVFAFPGAWRAITANHRALVAIETIGIALAFLCLGGMLVLIVRRMVSSRVQAVTTNVDLVVQGLLLVQIVLGLGVAMSYRWGAAWAPGTVVPYLWSIVTLQPDVTFVSEMPGLVKAHIAGAWVIIGLIPFSRLVHMFTVPLHYLVRAPQVVVWGNLARVRKVATDRLVASRRLFIRGTIATASGVGLLGVGVLDKFARYFQGPKLTEEQRADILEERLVRVNATAEQRALELERLRSQYIAVGPLAQLDAKKGQYFIDYEMRPALAFKGDDGLPILISAKCTHLGCTVASEMNDQGQILCPCHISYFDVKTGAPNPGAPAKAPLPHLDWVLMDAAGAVVGRSTEPPAVPASDLAACTVFIPKRTTEEA